MWLHFTLQVCYQLLHWKCITTAGIFHFLIKLAVALQLPFCNDFPYLWSVTLVCSLACVYNPLLLLARCLTQLTLITASLLFIQRACVLPLFETISVTSPIHFWLSYFETPRKGALCQLCKIAYCFFDVGYSPLRVTTTNPILSSLAVCHSRD